MKKLWLVRAFSETLTFSFSLPLRRNISSAASTISIKRVTKSNFDSSLEDLRNHVRNADFVAVDLEMTGLTSAPWRECFEFDRFDVQYLKVKDSAEKFAVVQFGVCPFRWDSSKESFVAHPHNFYIFPRRELSVGGPSHEFLCQTTSMAFLAKHQFDFNACIHEGISYLSRAQEAEALCSLNLASEDDLVNARYHSKDDREIPLVSMSDVLFTERMKIQFREWRDQLLRNARQGGQFGKSSDESRPHSQTVFFKMRPALLLYGFTSHQLRLIRLVIVKHYKDLTFVRVSGEDSLEQKLVVYTDSEEDKTLLMKAVEEDLSKEMEGKVKAAAGFRHVIDLLASEQKLVIGHNCFLDLAHVHSKFCSPLPSSVAEFVSSLHKLFPNIIDTKRLLKADSVIQHLMKRNSTSLSLAFALLCPQIASPSSVTGLGSHPSVKVEVEADETRSSWNSGAKHEAGYDAFMTGCVFAQACSLIGINFKLHSPSTELVKNEKLQKHLNRLYLSWNSGTIIDLKTGCEIPDLVLQNHKRRYPKIFFANIVLLWGFPSKFKPRELRECIGKVFGSDAVTSIYFLDETAAFVQFSKQELVNDFLVLKDSLEKKNDPISVLHPLANLLEGGNTRAANYETYKQICASPMSRFSFAEQAEAVGIRWMKEVDLREESEVPEMASVGGSKPENLNSEYVGRSSAKKGDIEYESSCERILDTLYASESLLGKRTRTV